MLPLAVAEFAVQWDPAIARLIRRSRLLDVKTPPEFRWDAPSGMSERNCREASEAHGKANPGLWTKRESLASLLSPVSTVPASVRLSQRASRSGCCIGVAPRIDSPMEITSPRNAPPCVGRSNT